MQRQLIHPIGLLAGLILVVSACVSEPDYSKTPAISFKGLFAYQRAAGTGVGQSRRDSLVVIIGFQDGDGDLGENTSDTARIRQVFGKESWGNYELRTFEIVNGKPVELSLAGNKVLFFPRLTKDGQKGAIEGTLDFSQKFFYQTGYRLAPVKFQIRVRDRALNVSNMIETDTIRVPLSGR